MTIWTKGFRRLRVDNERFERIVIGRPRCRSCGTDREVAPGWADEMVCSDCYASLLEAFRGYSKRVLARARLYVGGTEWHGAPGPESILE